MFQNLSYKLQGRLSDVLPNQQSHQKYVQRCIVHAAVPYQAFHHVLTFGTCAVTKPTVSPVYRLDLRERSRGEAV